MAYYYQRWKKNKSSIIPIEEIYTDNDINENDPYDKRNGYRFDTPRRWANDPSRNKSVGVRDLHLTPSSGDIRCRFVAYVNVRYKIETANWVASGTDLSDPAGHYAVDESTADYNELPDAVKFQCVSDLYECNITPNNNFEEIITSMIDFLNNASWKGINVPNTSANHALFGKNVHQADRKTYYVKEKEVAATTGTDATAAHTEYENLDYILNWHSLKLPITFNYDFDANTADFVFKNNTQLRTVVMDSVSKMVDTINSSPKYSHTAAEVDGSDDYKPIDEALNKAAPYTHTVTVTIPHEEEDASDEEVEQEQPLDSITVYDPNPVIYSAELLLLVERRDDASLKGVYDLFNQKLNNKNTLPQIKVDDSVYVIPFLSREQVASGDYKSRFNVFHGQTTLTSRTITKGNTVLSNNNGLPGFRTNVHLDNVWDRLHLNYHATFAETKHRIIGRNGDHWDTPNKQFMIPTGDQDQFNLFFTTDGVHHILPIGCHFNVDLTFILNPTKNTATNTGSHDMFKD